MKRLITAFACMLAVVFISGTLTAQEWSNEDKELWQVVETSWQKWAEKDIEGTLAIFHEKYQGWRNEAPLPSDKARVRKMFNIMLEKGDVTYMDLQPVRIALTKDAAVVHYFYSIAGNWGGEEEYMHGTNTEFYVKEDGEWKLLGDFTWEDDDDDD